jgi:hypothetical protein
VTNNATVNEILTDEALLKRQKREIEQLRARLQAGGGVVDEAVVEVTPSPRRGFFVCPRRFFFTSMGHRWAPVCCGMSVHCVP